MAFWKKKEPAEPMISKAEHDRIVTEKNGDLDRIASQLFASDRLISKLKADVTAAEMAYTESRKGHQRVAAELAALKVERDKTATEIAHWKKHGQLRDPATGRLIPKAQAARGGDVREGV